MDGQTWGRLKQIQIILFEDLLAWKFSQVYFFDTKLLFYHLQVIFSSSIEGIIHKMNETTVTTPL